MRKTWTPAAVVLLVLTGCGEQGLSEAEAKRLIREKAGYPKVEYVGISIPPNSPALGELGWLQSERCLLSGRRNPVDEEWRIADHCKDRVVGLSRHFRSGNHHLSAGMHFYDVSEISRKTSDATSGYACVEYKTTAALTEYGKHWQSQYPDAFSDVLSRKDL